MKDFMIIGLLLIVIVACKKEQQKPLLEISILTDATDDGIVPVPYEDVRQFIDFNTGEHLWYEHSIRTRELVDIRYGTTHQVSLQKGDPYERTDQQRKVEVRGFLKQVEAMFSQQAQGEERAQSELFFPIAEELNKLASSTAINKVMVISSNLLENTGAYSVFRDQDRQLLFEEPDSVANILESELPLQELSGITVYIVYRANTEDHQLFSAMSALYNHLLTAKGATVHIAANLNPEPLYP